MSTYVRVRLDADTAIRVTPGHTAQSATGADPFEMPPHLTFQGPGVDLAVVVDLAELRRIRDAIDTALTEHGDQP